MRTAVFAVWFVAALSLQAQAKMYEPLCQTVNLSPFYINAGAKWGFIDSSGNVVVAPDLDSPPQFSKGLAFTYKNGYIDKFGKWAIPPQFAEGQPFYEGLAAVRQSSIESWGYISQDGAFVIPPIYSSAQPFSEGLAAVTVASSKSDPNPFTGFIDKGGTQ